MLSDIKKMAIEESMETIKIYRNLLDSLERDIKDDNDEKQQIAAIAIRTLYFFLSRDEGFRTWQEELYEAINEKIMSKTNNHSIH